MRGLLGRVIGERITVRSELPLDEAARWLGSAVIVGRSAAGVEIRREAGVLNPRGGWQPELRGRLTAAGEGDGCRFDGVIGPRVWQIVFAGFWAGGLLTVALGLAVVAVVRLVRGESGPAGEMAVLAVLAGCASLMMPAVVVAGYFACSHQVEALRSWLTGALHTRWYGPGGPRPRSGRPARRPTPG
jgi:hypothetical protein